MTKFESSVKTIPYSQESVYNKLSDLNNLEAIKGKIPADKIGELTFDKDSLTIEIPNLGQKVTLNIIEREPSKCIKFEAAKSPIPFNMWIQIVALAEEQCKVKVTAGMEINPFMKAMVQKPLTEGLEKMVDLLSIIQY